MLLYRGDHRLSDISQACATDWDALHISQFYGGCTTIVRYTIGGRNRYALYAPDAPYRWYDFGSREELQAWADAYGCTIDPEGSFRTMKVHFPTDADGMRPLRTVEVAA